MFRIKQILTFVAIMANAIKVAFQNFILIIDVTNNFYLSSNKRSWVAHKLSTLKPAYNKLACKLQNGAQNQIQRPRDLVLLGRAAHVSREITSTVVNCVRLCCKKSQKKELTSLSFWADAKLSGRLFTNKKFQVASHHCVLIISSARKE